MFSCVYSAFQAVLLLYFMLDYKEEYFLKNHQKDF